MRGNKRVTVEGIVCEYGVDGAITEVGVCTEAVKGHRPYSRKIEWRQGWPGRELLRPALDGLRGRAVRVTIEVLPATWSELRVDEAGEVIKGRARGDAGEGGRE